MECSYKYWDCRFQQRPLPLFLHDLLNTRSISLYFGDREGDVDPRFLSLLKPSISLDRQPHLLIFLMEHMEPVTCLFENSVRTRGSRPVIATTFKSTFSITRSNDPSADPAGRPSRNPSTNDSFYISSSFLVSPGYHQ